MPKKGAMYPFRITCLTKQIGNKPIDLPDKEVDAKDEIDAIRWYCATTPHPFNPSKGLDVSSFRFRVTILTDERLEKTKKKPQKRFDGDTRSIMKRRLPIIKIFSSSSILLQRLVISVPFRTWESKKPSLSNNQCPRLIVWI